MKGHGIQGSSLVGSSLYCNDKLILDKDCNLNVDDIRSKTLVTKEATINGNLVVTGDITGNVVTNGNGGDNSFHVLDIYLADDFNAAGLIPIPLDVINLNQGWMEQSPGEWSPPVDGFYDIIWRYAANSLLSAGATFQKNTVGVQQLNTIASQNLVTGSLVISLTTSDTISILSNQATGFSGDFSGVRTGFRAMKIA